MARAKHREREIVGQRDVNRTKKPSGWSNNKIGNCRQLYAVFRQVYAVLIAVAVVVYLCPAVVIAVVPGWNLSSVVALAVVGLMWDAVAVAVAVVRWDV